MTATSVSTIAATIEKSYPFPFWSGFFEKKHYRAMGGGPVFLFGYLINKTTKENSTTDGNLGIVLGGKPIKDREIAKHYGISSKTIARLRDMLIAGRYIECQRTPYGYSYKVRKSKKFGLWAGKRSDRSVRNKEDHVVDHVLEAAAAQECWKAIGENLPLGTTRFQGIWSFFFAHKNGEPLSGAMERTIQRAQAQKIPVPKPFYTAKRRVEERETRQPEAEPIRTLTPEEIPA